MDSGIEIASAGLPHKVSCIRWVPEQLDAPNTFLTSSWDCAQNSVTLWSQFHNVYGENDQKAFPEALAVKYLPGDIVQFEFIDEKTIACVTSEGALNVLAIATDMIEEKFAIPDLHQFDGFKAACTGVSVYDRDIATIGEDGCLKIVSMTVGEVLRTIKDKNTCSLCCISFVNPDTVLVSSRCGNIDCYDIRTDSDEPVLTLSTLSKSEDEDGLTDTTCISYQPVQNQIVFAGLEDGSIMGWDLRKPDIFSTHLKPHESSVNAIAFRRDDPKRMFSGTESGEVFQWLLRSEYSLVGDYFDQLVRSYGPVIENYSAINSIDVNESHMICSGDDAFVHVFEIQEE